MRLFVLGEFIAAGGEGGTDAEHGGPGTIYLHLLPEVGADQLLDGTTYVVTADSTHEGVHTNRTLYIDNRNRPPNDVNRNMTDAYADLRYGNARAWVIPHPYSSIADDTIDGEPDGVEFIVDYLQIYGAGQVMLVDNDVYT